MLLICPYLVLSSLSDIYSSICIDNIFSFWVYPNSQVTSSSLQVRRLKAWVAGLKTRVERLKAQVRRLKGRVGD